MTAINNATLLSLQEAQLEWFASIGLGAIALAANWQNAGQALSRQWVNQTGQTLASWSEKGLFPAAG